MPAIDQCEPQVIAALEKQGWRVTHQPYFVRLSEHESGYPDLRLQHIDSDAVLVIVEVKCFADRRSYLDEFYSAVGQFLYYRVLLQTLKIDVELYLAVPLTVYNELFTKQSIRTVVQSVDMKLIVIDTHLAEVVEWIS